MANRKSVTNASRSNLSSLKEKKIMPNKPEIIETDPYYKCCACGKKYTSQKGNFPFSQSPFFHGNDKYLPICSKCVDKFTDQYTDLFGGDQDKAMARMCLHWDIYFNESLLESSKKNGASYSRIKMLIRQCNMAQNSGKTYDTYLEESDKQKIGVAISEGDLDKLKAEENIKLSKNSLKTWGFGFSIQEMEFLDNELSDWKSKTVIEGKSRESLVKELCILELQKKKALLEDKVELYQKLTESFQKTLDRANLTPKQEDASDKAGEKPLGVMIDMFENEQPIPEPLDCWKDVDGIMKLIVVYFIGHLCKMLGIKNRYAQAYEEEMDKYRVEIPELEEADSEDIFSYLLENGFESGESNSGDSGEA